MLYVARALSGADMCADGWLYGQLHAAHAADPRPTDHFGVPEAVRQYIGRLLVSVLRERVSPGQPYPLELLLFRTQARFTSLRTSVRMS